MPRFEKQPILAACNESDAVHSILVRAERPMFDLIANPNPNSVRFTGTVRLLSRLKTAEHDVTIAQQRALGFEDNCSDRATITSINNCNGNTIHESEWQDERESAKEVERARLHGGTESEQYNFLA